MKLELIERKAYYRIDVEVDAGDAEYVYRSVDEVESAWGGDFEKLIEMLRLLNGVVGKQFGLEELCKSGIEPYQFDMFFEFMPTHRFSAENRHSPSGHTLESLRVRYYDGNGNEYEVIL